MTRALLTKARRAQLVTTYGVGALFPAGESSFMIPGLDAWPDWAPQLDEPRLAMALGVNHFRQPPAGNSKGRDLGVIRFPQFHFCPVCRRLAPIRDFCDWNDNTCKKCSSTLVPSRFVVCCSRGHIDEFPYRRWVHPTGVAATASDSEGHRLELHTRGLSSSLADIEVRCSCGVPPVTMERAFHSGAASTDPLCRSKPLAR